jgi:TRAP-type mannitol/chloroaromatic compound transport system permease small subunit
VKKILVVLDNIDQIDEWIGRIFCFAVVILTVVVSYEVIMRKFFAHPSTWSYDVAKQAYAVHFLMIAGWALLHKQHVAVDVFSSLLSARKKAIIDIIGYLIFFFPFSLVMIWFGVDFAGISWMELEKARDTFPIPLYPIKTVIPLAFTILFIQGLSDFIRKILILRGEV